MPKSKKRAQKIEPSVESALPPISSIEIDVKIIVPIPCTVEEVERHLRTFIQGFLEKDFQERWITYLVENLSQAHLDRSRWDRRSASRIYELFTEWLLSKSQHSHSLSHVAMKAAIRNNTFTNATMRGQSLGSVGSVPFLLAEFPSTTEGIYFDVRTVGRLTIAEAAVLAVKGERQAIFSIRPGKTAIFFNQETEWEKDIYIFDKSWRST